MHAFIYVVFTASTARSVEIRILVEIGTPNRHLAPDVQRDAKSTHQPYQGQRTSINYFVCLKVQPERERIFERPP